MLVKPVYDIPYVPSSWNRLATIMELADVKPGLKTLDLGSGDGRVVIAMAKKGADAYGFEVDEDRVKMALKNIESEGLNGNAHIQKTSFWDEDLSDFDIITIYGITSIMSRLEQKLRAEIKPGGKIICNYFNLPTWKHWVHKNDIYLYQQI
jgi:cyclopropane fatty-acyl-phospholipid synthase-like methyltransferase